MVGNVVGADNVTPYQVSGLFRCDIGVNSRESDALSTVYERFIHMFKEIMHMQPRSKVLGMLRQTDHPTLVFSSTNVFGGVLEEGEYVLFYPHWYQATLQGSLQLVAKTSIPMHKVPRTCVGQWKLDLETLLDMPLDQRLQPRQANTPCLALFDYDLAGWQEDGMLTQFHPLSYVYLDPFFYRTDKQGRLEALGPFSLDAIPPEQWTRWSDCLERTRMAVENPVRDKQFRW